MHFHKPKKIHWRRFINRKIIAVAVVITVAQVAGAYLHAHALSKGGEMMLGVTLEHLIFGVPFEE